MADGTAPRHHEFPDKSTDTVITAADGREIVVVTEVCDGELTVRVMRGWTVWSETTRTAGGDK